MSASRYRLITTGPCPDCEGRQGRHVASCTAEADYFEDTRDDFDPEAEEAAMAEAARRVDAYRRGSGTLFSN